MLYPDSENRIEELNKLVELFKIKGHPKTAKEALSFADMLRESSFPLNLTSKFNGILKIFEEEFTNSLTEGKAYRAKVFNEVKEIVIGAFNRTHPEFFIKYSEILPILNNIKNAKDVCGDIADETDSTKKSYSKVDFYLTCYSYMILVEGIFDEICRALYFFSKLSKTNAPKASTVFEKQVRKIIKEFDPVPVFLENWEEKRHIRNAIAHATTYYDPVKDEVRFVDTLSPSHYDKTMKFRDFLLIDLELEDLAESFLLILCLLGLLELFARKKL